MSKTPDYFHGKTILITGAGSGIGRASAVVFAREGANVVCTDIDIEAAERTANQVIQIGTRASCIRCDVTDRSQVDSMVRQAIDEYKTIDFELNSAGGAFGRSPFLKITGDLWDKTYDLNVKGTFNSAQAILPHMLENGAGVIINIASVAAKVGGGGNSVHYASSKGAVDTMTLGIAREFARKGIRCLSISPGLVDTAFHNTTPPEVKKEYEDLTPMGRMALPEEIAETILFACSDAAPYMTADTIYVSGGLR
ncbi:MAG: short-chain dehydrogenase [Rhodospirillaceae bacterium]|nr:short-chain dehydrogenase [Rhodospirillaceae bacterium]|tara:strand:- start:1158 stop:1916 length:759 start_codon:yes stop_codon:yes gene_type:complete